ncbi:MAG: TRAP transporter large permease subunit [Lentisphaerae bacterium]|nr:TRAP transporter large permease subunit [Lentisphaerota bacterium]
MSATWAERIPLAVFVAAYLSFVFKPNLRAWAACAAAIALLILGWAGAIPWSQSLGEVIQWNVLALMAGMMVIAHVFEQSRIPAVLAEMLVDRSPDARWAFIWITALISVLSMFLDNVSCVLLIAPVALSLARKLGANPVRPVICLAVAANLQGAATLIGDPPSMLLAGHMKLSFNDFFFYQGKPSMFWVMQAGALASGAVVFWVLRAFHRPNELVACERARSWTPLWLIVCLVAVLAAASSFDPGFVWFAGSASLVFAAVAALWAVKRARWCGVRALLTAVDFTTLFFLMGMFVLVEGLDEARWMERIASALHALVGGSLFGAFAALVVFSVLVSAVVDNVPFLLAMLPVVGTLARQFSPADAPDGKLPLLMFALLAGACLGGNITPIGASANVVAMGILRKAGHPVSFPGFMRIGVPFTLAALLAGAGLIWLVWA